MVFEGPPIWFLTTFLTSYWTRQCGHWRDKTLERGEFKLMMGISSFDGSNASHIVRN